MIYSMDIVVICNFVFIYFVLLYTMYNVHVYTTMFNVQFAMSILAISLDTLGSTSIRLIKIYTKVKRCARQVSKT